jgi:phosphoribosyl 1,2-cyclic phosphodiesterase
MRFAVLGSGSAGNSAVVECGGLRLLIDAGLSAKQLILRLRRLGIEPQSLDGILLTHEHGDHVRGLKVLLKQVSIPVFATAATAHIVREMGINDVSWKIFEAGQRFAIGGTVVESFPVLHDAVDPVGFVICNEIRRLGMVSDVGFIPPQTTERLRRLDALFIESNYDEQLLEADIKRPWSVKQRISSQHGHLSNGQVAELLRNIAHPALVRVVLGHLSADCNSPETALSFMRRCLEEVGHWPVNLHCACQTEPSEWFAL